MLLRQDRQWRDDDAASCRSAEAHVERARRVGDGSDHHRRRRPARSSRSTRRPKRVFRWPRAGGDRPAARHAHPARASATAHRAHVERFAATGVTSRRMGAHDGAHGAARRRRGVPDRGVDLAARARTASKRFTVILRDVTERVRGADACSRAARRGCAASSTPRWTRSSPSTSDQHIVLFNAAAEAMFGCPRERGASARRSTSFIPERFRGAHGGHVRRFGERATSASRRMGAARAS